jgi:hypothetical protein
MTRRNGGRGELAAFDVLPRSSHHRPLNYQKLAQNYQKLAQPG